METFAVYWEPVIKTYGIFERTGLCLVSFDLKAERIGDMGDCLLDRAVGGENGIILVFARLSGKGGLVIHVLLAGDSDPAKWFGTDAPMTGMMTDVQIDKDVELVYFQGPHFGDRYGIAAAALKALASHDVSASAMVCTGASMYLITPKGGSRLIKKALSDAFCTP